MYSPPFACLNDMLHLRRASEADMLKAARGLSWRDVHTSSAADA